MSSRSESFSIKHVVNRGKKDMVEIRDHQVTVPKNNKIIICTVETLPKDVKYIVKDGRFCRTYMYRKFEETRPQYEDGWCSLGGHATILKDGMCLGCKQPAPTAVKLEVAHYDRTHDAKLRMKPVVVLKKLKIVPA
ncbi:unnamed protein product [Allacma fusca]|uniref:Uncharacterized protein n=1 Tax=Allacma fusca TaxID=39272 RepID=A0A8J2L357_9HEXA|nr:unnamed protein product [Allacma fusca]